MRKAQRKALVMTAFVFAVVALAGMVSTEASEICAGPSYQVCVLVNEPGVYSGGKANGVMLYTGPTVGGHVLLECSSSDNDQLHANVYVADNWVAYNPTFDRQICS
ncbi:MAG: hypothetical protein WEB06_00640 [Actinomycetota bacterium]